MIDQITVYLEGFREPFSIPIIARPATAKLQIAECLDFGVVPKVHSSAKVQASKLLDFDQAGVVTRYTTIENTGGKDIHVDVLVDERHPIRVYPMRFQLPAAKKNQGPSSVQLRVDFLPLIVGEFRAEVRFRQFRERRRGGPNTKSNGNITGTKADIYGSLASVTSLAPIATGHSASSGGQNETHLLGKLNIKAEILQRQLQIRDSTDSLELNYSNIDFGNIFSNEKATMNARIVNRGPASIRWVCFMALI